MKKLFLITLCFVLIVSVLTGCGKNIDVNGNEIDKQSQEYIGKALSIVNKEWKTAYSKNADRIKSDKTVEIINTRIIKIKDNNTEEFKDIVAVVEFDILSDYYGSSPYYSNIQQYDTVAFYKDGSTKAIDAFGQYRSRKYVTDYSDIIESVVECGEAYNTKKIKVESPSNDNNELVEHAIETLKTGWIEDLIKHNGEKEQKSDGTLRICNTRMEIVNQNSTYQNFDKYFGNIKAIVEFEVYSDYYGSSPYYVNAGINDTVLVHLDGTMELASHYVRNVGSATYNFNFTDAFSEIRNFGNKYNQTFNLLGNGIESLDDDYSDAIDKMN